MRLITVLVLFSCLLVGACTAPDRSILVKDGDEFLDCAALDAELDFAENLGENAPARRRHIKALQAEKQCVMSPNMMSPRLSISIGVSKSFN